MINVRIFWNEGEKEVTVPSTESDVFREIGMVLPEISVPNVISVETSNGSAEFNVGRRGSFVKDGIRKPSMYVTVVRNNICGLEESKYEERYLTCINPESNNYKFYHLRPYDAMGHTIHIDATYGRIGSERGEAFGVKDLKEPYPAYLFWIRYYEKLSKGYIDQSDVYLSSLAKPKTKKKKNASDADADSTAANPASAELYALLKAYAKHVVETNLVCAKVTQKQITESKKIWNQLCNRKTVRGFNAQLMRLMSVCPRKVRDVRDLLAITESDFPSIIDREESLIKAMEAVVDDNSSENIRKPVVDFASYGIEVFEANEKQKEIIEKHLSDQLKDRVKKVWRVIPKKQQRSFNEYLKKNKIKTVKQFWHGSRNENWFSILTNGLQLHPDAAITGAMLGKGIYFAPSSLKSWNYTSYRGTYWAHGSSDTAFMGLYATAYGNPYDASSDIRSYTASEVRTKGYDCVHAKGGPGYYLKNDEVVFYSEDAMVLNYIVEFQ